MGTSNFCNNNTNYIFVVEDDTDGDSWLWDMKIENIQCSLKENGYEEEGREKYELRSFPGRYIASKTIRKTYCGLEVGVTIKLILRSGYYKHANVDWELEWGLCDRYDIRPNKNEILYMLDCYDVNPGMKTIQSKNVENFLKKTEEELIEETEKILKEITTRVGVVARFSNGETMYKKIERSQNG